MSDFREIRVSIRCHAESISIGESTIGRAGLRVDVRKMHFASQAWPHVGLNPDLPVIERGVDGQASRCQSGFLMQQIERLFRQGHVDRIDGR